MEFKTIIDTDIDAFLSCSEKLGGDIFEQAKSVKAAFVAQSDFILKALTSAKPDQVCLLPGSMADLYLNL